MPLPANHRALDCAGRMYHRGLHKQCVHGKPSRVHAYGTSSKSFCLWECFLTPDCCSHSGILTCKNDFVW